MQGGLRKLYKNNYIDSINSYSDSEFFQQKFRFTREIFLLFVDTYGYVVNKVSNLYRHEVLPVKKC